MSNQLFTRTGTEFPGTAQFDAKGAAFYVRDRPCGRCGGLGGGEQWRHTGWTCYDCGGARTRGTEVVKLYSAEKLASLNATQEKRRAVKRVAADAKAAKEAAAALARKAAFEAEHGALLDSAAALAGRDWFVDEIAGKARRNSYMSDKQADALRAAIAKITAADAAKSASQHVGRAIGYSMSR